MQVAAGWLLDLKKNEYKELSFETLEEELSHIELQSIRLEPEVFLSNDRKIVYTDSEHPLMYVNNLFFRHTLGIKKDYYLEHKEELESKIVSVIEGIQSSYIEIVESELITPKIIDAVANNKNIKSVSLGNSSNLFALSVELYEKFKSSGKEEIITKAVVPELLGNFDPIIEFNERRCLVGHYKYKDLCSKDEIYIDKDVNNDDIPKLKYLNYDAKVKITYGSNVDLIGMLDILCKINPERNIEISVNDKNEFNSYFFEHVKEVPNNKNILINLRGTKVDYKTYLENEKRLLELVKPVIGLSPFIQYLYIYDLVSKFKEYKENEEDKSSARNVYQILDNEYMVCVGYASLLIDLLGKVGIKAHEYSVSVDIGFDKIPNDVLVIPDFIAGDNKDEVKSVLSESSGHARVFVELVDPNYGIDGYFIADPTWDNVMDEHTFNYSLMTHDEYNTTDRYNYMNLYNVNELFFVHSLDEFYKKLNYIMNKQTFRKLDGFIKEFQDYMNVPDKEDPLDTLVDIGEHIIEKTNNSVNAEQYRRGITELFRLNLLKVRDGKTIDEEVNRIMNYNRERQKKCFPERFIELKDGTRKPLFDIVNKFDEGNDGVEIEINEADMVRK